MASNRMDKTKAIPGFQNPKCYARALGSCSRQIDNEHYISRSILERIPDPTVLTSKAVLVRNLSFQQQADVLEPIGVGNLTSKMLCKTHNNALSDYDAAGLAMYMALELLDLEPRIPIPNRFIKKIDGDAFERWMLKALVGGLYSGILRLPPGMSMKDVQPTLDFLHILYRGAPFPTGTGMFWIPPKPGTFTNPGLEPLQLAPVPNVDNTMVGAFRVFLFGLEFTLLRSSLSPGVPTVFDSAWFRPAGLKVEGLTTEIRFKWKTGPGSDEINLRRFPS